MSNELIPEFLFLLAVCGVSGLGIIGCLTWVYIELRRLKRRDY
jgi:hypothetical protein